MIKPSISIVTVSYNIVHEIERTLMSIQNQSFNDFELIIVDGGSNDGTMKVIEKYRKNITTVVSEKDQGPYDAMNKGAELAQGELICFLNGGDEFFDSDVLSKVWQEFDSNNRPDIIYGNAYVVHGDGSGRTEVYPSLSKNFLSISMINHQAIFCSLIALRKIGGFDLGYKICADYDWLMRARYVNKLVFLHLDKTLVKFYLGGLSTVANVFPEREAIQSKYLGEPWVLRGKLDRRPVIGPILRLDPPALMNNLTYKISRIAKRREP